jgi:acyl dehydratase
VRYFEDFKVGDRFELGKRTLSREEIIAFAQQWDPQDFHTGARDSAFGDGVIASGVQTIAVFMRLFVDRVLKETAVVAGRQVERIRMLKPVLPGMELTGTAEVVRIEDGSRDDRGIVAFRGELYADETLVWEQTSETVILRQPTVAGASVADPVTLTLYAPDPDERFEDALWELDDDGPLVVSAVVPDGGVLCIVVEYEGEGGPEEISALLTAAVPGLEITRTAAGRQV